MKINDDEDALPLEHSGTESTGPQCPISNPPDYFRITTVNLAVKNPVSNYKEAMQLANTEAENRLGQFMLLSWYDKDRDFESPQHSSECHQDSAVPGYVDYGLNHGATLKVDIEEGRFVFFYMPIDL